PPLPRSGLKTDLTTLNDGSIWGWCICVVVVAFFSKFLSCGATAKAFGMSWRESGAAGSLMACKGLVELIVLNIGLNAGILNVQIFSMFVFMALITTFLTTPLTLLFYPTWYRTRRDRERRGLPPLGSSSSGHDGATGGLADEAKPRMRFAVVVEHFGQLPGVMGFLGLLKPVGAGVSGEMGKVALPSGKEPHSHSHSHGGKHAHDQHDGKKDEKDEKSRLKALLAPLSGSGGGGAKKDKDAATAPAPDTAESSPKDAAHFAEPVVEHDAEEEKKCSGALALSSSSTTPSATPTLSALRLVALTERTSTLLRSAEPEAALLRSDALASVVRAFAASVLGLPTHVGLSLTAPEEVSRAVAEFVEEREAEVVLLPWTLPSSAGGEGGSEGEGEGGEQSVVEALLPNPFEGLFFGGGKDGAGGRSVGVMGAVGYAGVVRRVFAESPCDVALLLDRAGSVSSAASLAPALAGRTHLHLTFHGGSDDRLALSLLVQLVGSNPGLTATVLRLARAPEPTDEDRDVLDGAIDFGPALASPPITREDAPLFTVSGPASGAGGSHGGIGIADTVYATNAGGTGAGAGVNALQSESADEALFARFFEGPTPLADEHTRARIDVAHCATAHPLRFANAKLAALRRALAPQRIPLVVFAGRGRRDAPSHASELAQLLKEHVDAVRASVLVSSEVRRAVGDVGAAVLLGREVGAGGGAGEGERVVVVQRRGKGGWVGRERDA
ncbi:hypothetical protein JCM6882_004114, partial [Rhodosporidiobolus microsporus]